MKIFLDPNTVNDPKIQALCAWGHWTEKMLFLFLYLQRIQYYYTWFSFKIKKRLKLAHPNVQAVSVQSANIYIGWCEIRLVSRSCLSWKKVVEIVAKFTTDHKKEWEERGQLPVKKPWSWRTLPWTRPRHRTLQKRAWRYWRAEGTSYKYSWSITFWDWGKSRRRVKRNEWRVAVQ